MTDDELQWHRVDLLEHGNFWSAPENEDWMRASATLVDAFTRFGRRAVSAGSCAEYDWAAGTCIQGITPLTPDTLYGQSKHLAQ